MFKMYRITCYCSKTEFYRTEMMKSWVNRKCKKCKSNLIIYENDTLVLNYNNKKERDLNRIKRIKKSKIVKPSEFNVFDSPDRPMLKPNFFPMFQMNFVPILPNPIKKDVFMGYHGQAFEFNPIEIQPFVFKPIEFKDMDIDMDIKSEFDEYKL